MKESTSDFSYTRSSALWTRGVFPFLKTMIRVGYFSLEVSGLENVPDQENLIYVANHSSWLALDGLLVPYALQQKISEEYLPYGIIHDVLFKLPMIGKFYNHCGAVPVSWVRQLEKMPKEIGSLGIFPEGDEGNSKPFWEAYQMRRWKRGFVKLALNRKSRVLPIAIQGLEESMPVAFTLKPLKGLLGTYAGYPLLPFPLPSKFKITFCPPIDLSSRAEQLQNNPQEMDQVAEEVQRIVQSKLDQETYHRPLAKLSRFISHSRYLRLSPNSPPLMKNTA